MNRSTGHGYCDDNRVRSHGEAADSVHIPCARANLFDENLPRQLCTARVQRGGTAINVVIARPAR